MAKIVKRSIPCNSSQTNEYQQLLITATTSKTHTQSSKNRKIYHHHWISKNANRRRPQFRFSTTVSAHRPQLLKTRKDLKIITTSFTLIWLHRTIVMARNLKNNFYRLKLSQIMHQKIGYQRWGLISNNRNYQEEKDKEHTKVDRKLRGVKTAMDWAINLTLWRHLKGLIASQHALSPQSMNTTK